MASEAGQPGSQGVFAVRVAGVRLVMPGDRVAGVMAFEAPTRIPRTPAYMLGLLPHGEGALAVVDLGSFLDLPDRSGEERQFSTQRVVIVRDGELESGLVCDQAFGVVELSDSRLEAPTVLKAGRLPEFVRREFDRSDARVGLLGLGLLVAYGVGRSIGARVRVVVRLAERVTRGEIPRETIDDPVKDEIGDIARSFSKMNENLNMLADSVSSVADGDLSSSVEGEGDLAEAFNRMIVNQRELVRQISTTATWAASFLLGATARRLGKEAVCRAEWSRTVDLLESGQGSLPFLTHPLLHCRFVQSARQVRQVCDQSSSSQSSSYPWAPGCPPPKPF